MTFSGVAHVSLTVTDLERSKRWYAELLGWEEMMAGESDGVSFGVGVLPGGQLLALRQHADGTGDDFDPRRTGLDHLSLDVGSADQLSDWERRFVDLGVSYTPTQHMPYGHVLNFKDPDGIALELFAAPSAQS
jgi:catechol 2,3-dioxygenase-like lactoylglutathione lyase family enzyme